MMAYNQFTLARVEAEFGIVVQTRYGVFATVPPVAIDAAFGNLLNRHRSLARAVNTEKARSELLISPIIAELWRLSDQSLAIFSGTRFDVDESVGLNGTCDFIIGRPPQLNYVTAPVMMIVEAKNEDIWGGVGQCVAEMVAAQRFNSTRNPAIATIHGAVTDGESWQLLRLQKSALEIDLTEYLIAEADRILGILLHIVGIVPNAAGK